MSPFPPTFSMLPSVSDFPTTGYGLSNEGSGACYKGLIVLNIRGINGGGGGEISR